MIHVGTREDVTGAMLDGWRLWGQRQYGQRGFTYWLQPPAGPYAAKRVSAKLVTTLTASGQITGAPNAYGDMIYRLGEQEALLSGGA